MRRSTTSFALFIAIASCLAHGQAGADWPQWMGPRRDGSTTESVAVWPAAGPRLLWKQALGPGVGCPVIVGGRLFTMGYAKGKEKDKGEDIVYCLDAATGAELWRFAYECPIYSNQQEDGGPAATPAFSDGRLVTLSRRGDLYCLDAGSGKPLWSRRLTEDFGAAMPASGFSGSPLIEGGCVYVDAGPLLALDLGTGEPAWRTADYGAMHASPIAFDWQGRRAIAAFNKSGLVVVDSADGRELVKRWWPDRGNFITPLRLGEDLFIASYYGYGSARVRLSDDGPTTTTWMTERMQNLFSSPVQVGDYLYGIDEQSLACQDARDGSIKWSKAGFGWGTLLGVGGERLLVLSQRGDLSLMAANPERFEQLAKARPLAGRFLTMPVVAHGRIYLRNSKNELACLAGN